VGLFVAAVVVVRWAPAWLDDPSGLKAGAEQAAERGRVRTGVLTLLGGALAAVGAVYTGFTFSLNRRGQATERFTRAVDQLASDKPDIRLGGIYALEQLARDSARDHAPIMEVLTAFVRRSSPLRKGTTADVSVDVQAALAVLKRRRHGGERERHLRFDLAETNLRNARVEGIVLRHARLTNACLEQAVLIGADLRDAGLIGTHLDGATLCEADLRDAELDRAHLHGANLTDAKLDRAELRGALYDDWTMWPKGFDPVKAGAVKAPDVTSSLPSPSPSAPSPSASPRPSPSPPASARDRAPRVPAKARPAAGA
jgi:hypothetical protein